jgi:hypothetical protein
MHLLVDAFIARGAKGRRLPFERAGGIGSGMLAGPGGARRFRREQGVSIGRSWGQGLARGEQRGDQQPEWFCLHVEVPATIDDMVVIPRGLTSTPFTRLSARPGGPEKSVFQSIVLID